MSKHKALELADCIEAGVPFDEGEIVEELRAQHALIVQMQETIEACHSALVRIREAGGKSTSAEILCERDLSAADQYLGEKA